MATMPKHVLNAETLYYSVSPHRVSFCLFTSSGAFLTFLFAPPKGGLRGMVDAARRLSRDTKKGEKLWQGRRMLALPLLSIMCMPKYFSR